MKKIVSAMLLFSTAITMCACKDQSVKSFRNGEGDKAAITMEVRANFSGCGIDGRDLGSGHKDFKINDIKEGDVFYGEFNGKLTRDSKAVADPDEYWYIKIDTIDEDGVKVISHKGDYDMEFGEEEHFETVFWVYDGTNYDYDIKFTKD